MRELRNRIRLGPAGKFFTMAGVALCLILIQQKNKKTL
jgi:hypothetical protein